MRQWSDRCDGAQTGVTGVRQVRQGVRQVRQGSDRCARGQTGVAGGRQVWQESDRCARGQTGVPGVRQTGEAGCSAHLHQVVPDVDGRESEHAGQQAVTPLGEHVRQAEPRRLPHPAHLQHGGATIPQQSTTRRRACFSGGVSSTFQPYFYHRSFILIKH